MIRDNYKNALAALVLIVISACLYFPWHNNPLVFDDPNLLGNPVLLDYATTPFSRVPRQLPYFTLGLEYVLSQGNFGISRSVNLLLHALNAYVLLRLIQVLLSRFVSPQRAFAIAACAAVAWVLHPVAVYAVGYLIQRSVLMATFFLLLSTWQLHEAMQGGTWRRAALAGLLYGLAVASKEHAVTGLLGACAVALLQPAPTRKQRLPVLCTYLAVAVPFALWVVSVKLKFVATMYEPDAHQLMQSTGLLNAPASTHSWVLSAALQCLFYFRYLLFWWWPDTAGMSIDIRPDFSALTTPVWLATGPLAFLAMAAAALYALAAARTKPAVRLFGFGMVWSAGLFLLELSTVRFQEPVVLYRSYLWAPGFLIAAAALAATLPRRINQAVVLVAAPLLAMAAWGRLHTFSNELYLWQEAAASMPSPSVPGASRIHYNLGLNQLRNGMAGDALNSFNTVIAHDPTRFNGYWGRASVYMRQGALDLAIDDLRTVTRLQPTFAMGYVQLGMLLRRTGQRADSDKALATAEQLGFAHMALH